MSSELKTREQHEDVNTTRSNHGSYAEAIKLVPEKASKIDTFGLQYGDSYFDAISNTVETYSYIGKNINNEVPWWKFWKRKWWPRAALLTGITTTNVAAGAVALPFATLGGISYGISRPLKWMRKKCFDNLDFGDFGSGVLSCFMAVAGALSYIVEKATKYIGYGLLGIANLPFYLTNKVNKKMVGKFDVLTKSDELRENTIVELKSLAKSQEKEKDKLKNIGAKIDKLKATLEKVERASVVDDLNSSKAVDKYLLKVNKKRDEIQAEINKLKLEYQKHEARFNESRNKIRDHNKKMEDIKKRRLIKKASSSQTISRS